MVQAVNAALGSCGHNEVPMTCMQLSVNACTQPQYFEEQSQSLQLHSQGCTPKNAC